jgi:hypothetical protein
MARRAPGVRVGRVNALVATCYFSRPMRPGSLARSRLALLVLIGLAAGLAACSDDTAAATGSGGSTTSASSDGGGAAAGGSGGDGSTVTGSGATASGSGSAMTGSSTTVSSTGAGGGGAGGEGSGGAPAVELCETRAAVCTDTAPSASGQGLVEIDRCGFALDRAASFDTLPALADDLVPLGTPVTLAEVLDDLNREPTAVAGSAVPGDPPGVDFAYRWDDEENDKVTWVPQGLTGSVDADATELVEGRKLHLVNWYFDEDAAPDADPKGVRLALVDVTDQTAPRYRFLLLVEPTVGPDIAPVPIHAGGIAWIGDLLYVADTSKGLRVFDMTRILQVDTSEDVIGCDGAVCKAGLYKYVVPQIGLYARSSPCAELPRFSFVALDRSSDPIQLVSGEYCADTACSAALAGRVFRWPLDPATGLLAGGERTWAADAFFMGERQVQGGVSNGDVFYLSSSEPAAGAGALFRVTSGASAAFDWIDAPEDVVIDTASDRILSLSEGLGERYVMSADLASYQP